MTVYYRMSPKNSVHEARRPRFAFDKIGLARYCLRSFVEAFKEVKPKMTFILDNCGKEWDEMLELCPFDYDVLHIDREDHTPPKGYDHTAYYKQLDLAKDVHDYVLFQEDDYVYLPGSGKKLLEALKVLEFVSPYDHLEFYTRNLEFHKPPFDIRLVGDHHWRTIDFCTMTWGCHSDRLLDYWDALHLHGCWDKDTWSEMGKRGAKLWTPIPSLATHMHKDFLSPGIDWERRFCDLDK
jgi:DNA-directed RNA polymerase subunit N (RpoN/RPB10)